jgi:6-phosphogluconolactonase
MTGTDVEIRVAPDAEQAADVVASLLAEASGDVVLTGGATPGRAYELAAERRRDWADVELWWGDERCVPPEDERSNYRLAREALLDRVDSWGAVHRIRGELGPDTAADDYDAALRGRGLDLLLLGVGPDGHTASLFPNAPSLDARERLAVAAPAALEPFVDRVTLTLPAIASAELVVFLATGGAKSDAVARAFAEPPSPATPASLARGRQTIAVLDPAAAARLN